MPIIPLILIVVSLVIIGFIVVRKFPQLSLMDIDGLPEVQQGKKKNTLLRKRQEKQSEVINRKAKQAMVPVVKSFKTLQSEFRKYVSKVQRTVDSVEEKKTEELIEKIEEKPLPKKKTDKCDTLIKDARAAYDEEDFVAAEKMCIAVIKQNPKCVEAYIILGDVYSKQDQLVEAEQTYQFLLQLDGGNEHGYIRLAEIAEERGELHKAVDYYQEAVLINDSLSGRFQKIYDLLMQLEEFETAMEAIGQAVTLEPSNPKYLDNLVEASIIVGDKRIAEDAYERLRMVNPENNKLEAFRQRIKKIG